MQTISAQMKGKMVDSGDSIHLLAPSHSVVSVEQLAKAASLRPESVRKFVDVGLIEPSCQTWSGPLFPRSSLERLRRILRLRHDLGISGRYRCRAGHARTNRKPAKGSSTFATA
jgi:hypothetical protein